MDWLPTLLAAAGTSLDPAYPPDGMNLLPVLIDTKPAVQRSLFWRYKANAQRAARVGNYKYLKILNNTFLFDVAADPMERANLRERKRETYNRLESAWFEWNAQMLPETDASFTDNFTGDELADHIGATKYGKKADNPTPKTGSGNDK